MKNIIQNSITIIIYKPKFVLVLLAAITIFLSGGLTNLVLDPSTEYLMPKNTPIYKLSERAKIVFADSKTFIIAALLPNKEHELFSVEVFEQIGTLVRELEEYHYFNIGKENKRLQTILQMANVDIQAEQLDKTILDEKNSALSIANDLEKQLEETILGTDVSNISLTEDLEKQLEETILNAEDSHKSLEETILNAEDSHKSLEEIISQQSYAEDNIWDINTPLLFDNKAQAIRKRNTYNYNSYIPVTLTDLKAHLDEVAFWQMETILLNQNMQNISHNKALNKNEFKNILEAWEDIYLFKSMRVLKIFNNPFSGQDIKGSTNELFSVDFIEQDKDGNFLYPQTKEEFNHYKKKITLNPLNEKMLYTQQKNGNIEALAFNLIFRHLDDYGPLSKYFWSIFSKYDGSAIKIYTNGTIIFEKFVNDYIERDLKLFVPLVFLVVLLTFYFNFGSLRGVILPSLAVLLGMIWTMGTMGYLNIRISMLVSILPPLLLAIGSSYSIHVFNQYMKSLKPIQYGNKKEELKKSMLHIFPTVFLVSFTTIISFLTLAPSQVASLREFGIFAAVGSFYSAIIAFLMIPAALSLLKELPHEKFYVQDNRLKQNFIQNIVDEMANLSIRYSKTIVIFFNILIVIGFFGILQVEAETTPMTNFKANSYIRQSDSYLGNQFDGTFLINLIIDSGKENGVKETSFLQFLEQIRQWTELPEQKEKYMILHYNSFADFIKRMHMAMNADNITKFKIPNNPQLPASYIEIFGAEDLNSDGRPDVFEQFVDAQYRRVSVSIRTGAFNNRLMTTASNRTIQKKVLQYLSTLENPHGYKWFFVGDALNLVYLAEYISESQIRSVLLSLVVLVLLIFLLFKSLLAGLIGIVPIVTSVTLVYGFMGYFNIPLDIPKVILSGVAIGIGIDDTIHYVKTLTHNVQHTASLEDAIRATHRESGLAIVYTSVALIFGFSVLAWSNFVPVYSLGYLVASVMLATTIGALLILPALIYFFNLKLTGGSFLDKFK